jgi:hypothetical protein
MRMVTYGHLARLRLGQRALPSWAPPALEFSRTRREKSGTVSFRMPF